MTHSHFFSRTGILLVCAIFCWYSPDIPIYQIATGVMIIMGQGHFLMTYLYHYKSGKVNASYLLNFILILIAIFSLYLIFENKRILYTAIVGYFIIHFLYDERFMINEKPDFSGWMRCLPTLLVLMSHVLTLHLGLTEKLKIWMLCASILIIVAYFYLFFKRNWLTDIYFLIIFLISCIFVFSEKISNPPNDQVVTFIVLSHFANWYLRYIEKPQSTKELKSFLFQVVKINTLIALGFIFYYANRETKNSLAIQFLGYFYELPFFYLWTFMHYVVTYRKSDMRNWAIWPNGNR